MYRLYFKHFRNIRLNTSLKLKHLQGSNMNQCHLKGIGHVNMMNGN